MSKRNKSLHDKSADDSQMIDAKISTRVGDMRCDTTLAIQDQQRTPGRFKKGDVATTTKLKVCFPEHDTLVGHASMAARQHDVSVNAVQRARHEGAECVSVQRDKTVCDMLVSGADIWVHLSVCVADVVSLC